MPPPQLLALDVGTQSVRALLFDGQGTLQAKAQVPITDYQSLQPGWMECEPQALWDTLCRACRQLWGQAGVSPQGIAGVVLTTQRGTTVALDAHGQALRPAIIWLDQRRAAQAQRLAPWWELGLRAVGMRQTVRYFQHEAEANWIAQEQPDLWARTGKFLLLSGYLNYRLCGEFVDSVASQVGYVPFDYRRGRWASAHDWKWQALPITPAMLPQLCRAGAVLGHVSAQAARDTGLPEGLPIIAGAADKACEVLGAACLSPDIACLSFGTAASITTTTARYLEATPFVPPFQAAVPGHYNAEIQISRGFWMVNWFKEQFGLHEQQIAAQRGVAAESLFDELAQSVAPGSQGLMLQPFWNPGIKIPGPEARGALLGFSDVHTRSHLYRAILEGLAYGLREGKERIERRGGDSVHTLRVTGGGSQSDAALQITADVFNLPCERPATFECSGLGAAMLAAVGLGLYRDCAQATRHMCRVGQVFTPRPEAVALYEQLYTRVYRRMYPRLQPLYRELQEILR